VQVLGTAFTATNSCGGTVTVGQAQATGGYITASTGGTNCQFTFTIGGASPIAAQHGYYCSGEDFTSKVLAVQINQGTTYCILQVATVTANDIILWGVVQAY